MAEDSEGKDKIQKEIEGVLLEEQRDCLGEDKGEEEDKWGNIPWFPDHDERGLWIMEIFQYRCGMVKTIRTYRSQSLTKLVDHGREVCDEVETFFRIRPDDATMEDLVRKRNMAYQRPKDCFDHGPHHGSCSECKSNVDAVVDVAKEMGFKDKP